jgi:hypothetical protein
VTHRAYTPVLLLLAFALPHTVLAADVAVSAPAPADACQAAFTFIEEAAAKQKAAEAPKPVGLTPAPGAVPVEATAVEAALKAELEKAPANLTPKQKAAWDQVQELDRVKVQDLFPKKSTRDGKTRVAMTQADRQIFFDKFDEIWEKRIEAGIIPRLEVKRYKKWLRTVSPDKLPYPEPDTAALFTNYVEKGVPLADYFDQRFLDFIEKDRGISSFETLRDYLATIDPNFRRYWIKTKMRDMRRFGNTFKFAIATAIPTVIYTTAAGYPTAIANKLLEPWTSIGVNFVKEKTDTVTTTIVDYGKLYAQKKELEKAVEDLLTITQQFSKAPLAPPPPGTKVSADAPKVMERQDAFATVETARAGFDRLLPVFKDVLASNKKDFDTSWADRLKDSQFTLNLQNSDYMRVKASRESLRVQMERAQAEGRPIPDGEDRMADYARQMDGFEDYMAGTLADYIFYKGTRGADNPISDVTKRNYEPVLREYMASMSLAKLRDSLVKLVEDHVVTVKPFIPKLTPAEETDAEKYLAAKKEAEALKAEAEKKRVEAEQAKAAAAAAEGTVKKKEGAVVSGPRLPGDPLAPPATPPKQ